MNKYINQINNNKSEDYTLSTDLLTSLLQEINSKLDTITSEVSEIKSDSKITKLEINSKIDTHEVRIKSLETDKATREKEPLKTQIVNDVFKGTIAGFAWCVGIALFIATLSTFGVPFISVLKALLVSVGGS